MRIVEPKVFLVGETRIMKSELNAYLRHIGVPKWKSDATTDAEKLTEVYGRLCYRSFVPGLNPNVKKIRERNKDYLENVIEVKHGSVLEHITLNFIFADVSRVFTHELVRHRVGVAISQESLRFVRLTDLGFWPPLAVRENEKVMEVMSNTFKILEKLQKDLAEELGLDEEDKKFAEKKKLTSAMRRIAPLGSATAIGWSTNIRNLRHVIEMRTDPAAEEEIRLVFGKVAEIVKERYPNLFADYEVEIADGLPWWHTKNKKV
ncbi:MAG: FAD-dependent thymidylate synthase [Candidatus Nealsonbacteria bacterium]|nr:FAD-dependent thymidylate synthase [Candidatus Nealsonbacteria bacterium]